MPRLTEFESLFLSGFYKDLTPAALAATSSIPSGFSIWFFICLPWLPASALWPAGGLVFSALMLGEGISLTNMGGLALIVAGVATVAVAGAREKKEGSKDHNPAPVVIPGRGL